MVPLRVYAVLAHASCGFCERYEAVDDGHAVAEFLRRKRASSSLGCWNADLFSVDRLECLVCLRADAMQVWVNEWDRLKARSRWLYVRDGPEWRVAHVCVDDLGCVGNAAVFDGGEYVEA